MALLTSERTPRLIIWLVIITCITSLMSALFDPMIASWTGAWGSQDFLAVSLSGMRHYYLFEPVTYLFINLTTGGITTSLILEVLFSRYLIWILGTTLLAQMGAKPVLRLFFVSGVVSGLVTLGLLAVLGDPRPLGGLFSVVFAFMTVWTMLYPDVEASFMLLFPIKAKLVLVIFLGLSFLMNYSQGTLPFFVNDFSGAIIGYLYGVLAWDLRGPFTWTHRFDGVLAGVGSFFREKNQPQRTSESYSQSQIFDIKTGEAVLDDDEFIDVMLAKISKHGEKALSGRERARMDKISKNKQR